MKIINKISVLLSAVLFAVLLTSCSEFMLIPLSIDYPFENKDDQNKDDKDNPSPSTYKINITEGLKGVETLFNQKVPEVAKELFSKLPVEGGDNAEITGFPKFSAQDILDLIEGKTVKKEIEFKIPVINEFKREELSFSICDFGASDFNEKDSATNTIMTIANLSAFCALPETADGECPSPETVSDESETAADESETLADKSETVKDKSRQCAIERCQQKADNTCLHIAVIQENESLKIKMAEHKDLKKYKKYLNKIYSATLNKFEFTIKNAPNLPGNEAFRLKAELYAQAIDPFKSNGEPCNKETDKLEQCLYKGVDEDGNLDDYFAPANGPYTYLIGVFKTDKDTYSSDQVMNLLYTYDGKNILQHAIKHLDFQLGIRSYYEFYPQALKSADDLVIEASIKAKLLFNVEPI